MELNTGLTLVALVMIVLVPLVPGMLRLRIRVLRWLGLQWLAGLHEKSFNILVWVVRSALVVFALILLGTVFL